MKFLSLLACVAILVLLSGCGRPPSYRGTANGSHQHVDLSPAEPGERCRPSASH